MQVSAYNFFTRSNRGAMVFNAVEGTFTKLDIDTYNSLRRKQVPEISEEFKSILLESGVIHDGKQELKVRSLYDLQRFAGTHINITIAPTIECNLACWYCYQNERRHFGVMDAATEEATLNFIHAATQGKKSFNVDWFGGEPLLAADLIERISTRLTRESEQGGAVYTGGSIITNGLLLDSKKADILKRAGIRRVQVSIDRLHHVPPTMRGLLLPNGDPSPITANVLKFKDQFEFHIRLNLSTLPPGELEAVEAKLESLKLRDLCYIARVEDNIAECSGPGRKAMAGGMTRKAYAKSKAAFGAGTQAHLSMMQRALTPKRGFCGATNGNLFVIDHRGDVSRCFISAGVQEESIGNVNDLRQLWIAEDDANPVNRKWKEYTPFDYDSCANCRVLPLCMGGCSHARVLHDAIKPPCDSIKHNINNYVKQIGVRLLEKVSSD